MASVAELTAALRDGITKENWTQCQSKPVRLLALPGLVLRIRHHNRRSPLWLATCLERTATHTAAAVLTHMGWQLEQKYQTLVVHSKPQVGENFLVHIGDFAQTATATDQDPEANFDILVSLPAPQCNAAWL